MADENFAIFTKVASQVEAQGNADGWANELKIILNASLLMSVGDSILGEIVCQNMEKNIESVISAEITSKYANYNDVKETLLTCIADFRNNVHEIDNCELDSKAPMSFLWGMKTTIVSPETFLTLNLEDLKAQQYDENDPIGHFMNSISVAMAVKVLSILESKTAFKENTEVYEKYREYLADQFRFDVHQLKSKQDYEKAMDRLLMTTVLFNLYSNHSPEETELLERCHGEALVIQPTSISIEQSRAAWDKFGTQVEGLSELISSLPEYGAVKKAFEASKGRRDRSLKLFKVWYCVGGARPDQAGATVMMLEMMTLRNYVDACIYSGQDECRQLSAMGKSEIEASSLFTAENLELFFTLLGLKQNLIETIENIGTRQQQNKGNIVNKDGWQYFNTSTTLFCRLLWTILVKLYDDVDDGTKTKIFDLMKFSCKKDGGMLTLAVKRSMDMLVTCIPYTNVTFYDQLLTALKEYVTNGLIAEAVTVFCSQHKSTKEDMRKALVTPETGEWVGNSETNFAAFYQFVEEMAPTSA